MRVDGDYSQILKPEERPCGHMFVRSDDAARKNPTYWGEFKFKTRSALVSFCFVIHNLNVEEKTYGISLFSDREFEWCFLTVDISFFDGYSRLIDSENFHVIGVGMGEIPEKTFNIIHLLLYSKLLVIMPGMRQDAPTKFYSTIHQYGYVFGIEKKDITRFEDENNALFEEFVAQMDLLLG